jgi:hypothetical protein
MITGESCSGRSTTAREVARVLVADGTFSRFKCCTNLLSDEASTASFGSLIPHHRRMDAWFGVKAAVKAADPDGDRPGQPPPPPGHKMLILLDDVSAALASGTGLNQVTRFVQDAAAPDSHYALLLVSAHPDPWAGVGRRVRHTLTALVPPSSHVKVAITPPSNVSATPSCGAQHPTPRVRRRGYENDYPKVRRQLELQLMCSYAGVSIADTDSMDGFKEHDDNSSCELMHDIIETMLYISATLAAIPAIPAPKPKPKPKQQPTKQPSTT